MSVQAKAIFCSGLLIAAICGCRGQTPEQPKADSQGRVPADVVLAAFQKAINGDFEGANEFTTEAFAKVERESRQSTHPVIQMRAWPFRIRGISDPAIDVKIGKSQVHPSGFVIVFVSTPTSKENESDMYDVVMRDGKWKIGWRTGEIDDPVVN